MKNLHPGRILFFEYIKPYEMSIKEVHQLTGIDIHTLRLFLMGKVDVNDNIASKLSKIFETTSQYWLNLQEQYNKS